MAYGISRYAFLVALVLTDIVGVGPFKPEPPKIAETVPAVVVETVPAYTEPETTTAWVPPQTAPQWQNNFKQYSVAGHTPPYEWQWYLYGKLEQFGIAWFYPYAICQIWQESRWNPQSTNGVDHGLCQFKGIYWDGWARDAGIPGADIWDAYAQMHVYAWMMSGYIRASGWNVEMALSMYFLGRMEYSAMYVGHVMRWLDYLEVAE